MQNDYVITLHKVLKRLCTAFMVMALPTSTTSHFFLRTSFQSDWTTDMSWKCHIFLYCHVFAHVFFLPGTAVSLLNGDPIKNAVHMFSHSSIRKPLYFVLFAVIVIIFFCNSLRLFLPPLLEGSFF